MHVALHGLAYRLAVSGECSINFYAAQSETSENFSDDLRKLLSFVLIHAIPEILVFYRTERMATDEFHQFGLFIVEASADGWCQLLALTFKQVFDEATCMLIFLWRQQQDLQIFNQLLVVVGDFIELPQAGEFGVAFIPKFKLLQ